MSLSDAIRKEKQSLLRPTSSTRPDGPPLENLRDKLQSELDQKGGTLTNEKKKKYKIKEAALLQKPTLMDNVRQFRYEVKCQVKNERDEKEDIKEGMHLIKGKLLQVGGKKNKKLIVREQQTKIFKMLKQERNAMLSEKERKAQKTQNRVDVDIEESEDASERGESSQENQIALSSDSDFD